ncbi:MAG: 3-deoxy-7-phosphoheptulonate synthase [Deltaproteobacteria bacterium]|nr:3-deoxy-7-phosphoheptulonate synthase [Deltaproteobacteria bacterium]MCB9787527.1 3-deoxy-7-phosphoheptulonate synthase [Deltaproteobacteria bacterium]
MDHLTDDLRIRALRPLIPPAILIEELPVSDAVADTVTRAREAATRILRGEDDRLVVVVGPCSIHDVDAARDYARLLGAAANRLSDDLLVIMRVYFEKPRTTVGWKGLINDPELNDSFEINRGLRVARKLLLDLGELGMPVGCEFLDTITPQFITDLVSWGAIGARTTESQVHRELASGLSVPVGFKNGTDGTLEIAIDAIRAAENPHYFLSVTKQGIAAIVATSGNDACHVILRGGSRTGPNYTREHVAAAADSLEAAGLPRRLMVDCSHANSDKDHLKQPLVCADLAAQVAEGQEAIFGVMIESHLVGGRQAGGPRETLTYGQSITDACVAWEDTVPMLEGLAQAVRERRGRRDGARLAAVAG